MSENPSINQIMREFQILLQELKTLRYNFIFLM